MWSIKNQKGKIGEKIVKDFLESKGFIVYAPITEGSHKIDFFAHSGKSKDVVCCEVKTKPRMKKFPKTGFNISCYKHYLEVHNKYSIPVFCAFVDEFERCIYGNWLSELGEPDYIGSVVVWHLGKMKKIADLTDPQVDEINSLRDSKYNYSDVKPFFN